MSRTLLGPGSRGDLAFTLQKALVTAGVPLPKVDEIYGGDTEKAIRTFQQRCNLECTGVVDFDTWTVLTRMPVPPLFERVLQLTAAFEGHNYTLAVGNFDGAGLTWGIIGFTLSNGEVQALLQAIDAASPDLIDRAFGPGAPALRAMLRAPKADQRAWAEQNSLPGGSLAEPWKSGFAALGNLTQVREEQRRRALQNYFKPAEATAARYSITSELGIALAFDIHVQNGGISGPARAIIERQLAALASPSELDRRRAIANAVADTARPQYREDVRTRKLAIACGSGVVHGRAYRLDSWGLEEVPARGDNA